MTCFIFHKWHGCKCTKCGKIRDKDHVWKNGVCMLCGKKQEGYEDPISTEENIVFDATKEDMDLKEDVALNNENESVDTNEDFKPDYYALTNDLANFFTFSIDESEADLMEEQLLKGGNEALYIIMEYLFNCGRGLNQTSWWNSSWRLVKLIRRFPDNDHSVLLNNLIDFNSNIYEYHTHIIETAQRELQLLEEANTI